MQKPTLCMICEKNPGTHSCSSCGRVVCDEHYDSSMGICLACKRGKAGLLPESIKKRLLR